LEESDLAYLAQLGIVAEDFLRLENEASARALIDRLGRDAAGQNVLFDMHAVPWLDSLELGALLEINKMRRASGQRLILYALRPRVRRLLETCRLTDYFATAIRRAEVEAVVRNLTEHLAGNVVCAEGALTLALPAFEPKTDFVFSELEKHGALKAVVVDAAQLDFIDSSGLGLLIFLKKAIQTAGIGMSVVNLAAKPRRIFEVAQVDKILLHA